jgi:hypothetical protein
MKIAIILIAGLVMTGCSSSPKILAEKPQYCYTSQTIVTENGGKVNSRTQVECTDDQIKRNIQVRLGMADHCGRFTDRMIKGGKWVEYQGISCQILDSNGSIVGWEVIQ